MTKKTSDKWNFDMTDKELKIYGNLVNQIDKVFMHTRENSISSRRRYISGVKHFAKYLVVSYRKQNMRKITPMHIEGYFEQMKESYYSKSYIETNMSAVRFFYDNYVDSKARIPTNKELGIGSRTKGERIGPDRAWTNNEINRAINLARSTDNEKIANMIILAKDHGFRIHEVTRLDRNHLKLAIQNNYFRIKGKGGLIRDIPLNNRELVLELYKKTPVGGKVFVKKDEATHVVIKEAQNFISNNRIKFSDKESRIITFHGLRHYYAQSRYKELLGMGYEPLKAKKRVSRELGHFRHSITDVYIKSNE